MKILAQANSGKPFSSNIYILFIGIISVFLLTTLISKVGFNSNLVPVLSIPVMIVLLFNFELIFILLIIGIFINIEYLGFSHIIVYALLLPFAYFINYKNIKISDFRTPITVPLLLYFFTLLLSLANSISPLFSLYMSYNYVAFLIIIFFTAAFINSQEQIKKYVCVFLFMVSLNSLHVIFNVLITHKRSFGFTGIMFVDYVGIGIVIIAASMIADKKKMLFKGALLLLFITSSIMTETRNPWITILLTIFIMLIYAYRKSSKIFLDKSRLRKLLLLFLIGIPLLVSFVYIVSPTSFERVDPKYVEVSFDEKGNTKNSFLTRIFIWEAAVNAFAAHPVIGIGAYAFPFSSQLYSTIPDFFYEMYVKDLSPHLGYLEVLTETGIIGMIAFLILLYSIIKYVFRSFRMLTRNDEVLTAMIVCWPLLYIVMSLMMTDAWLWGKGMGLWAFLIGLGVSFYKIKLGESV